MSQSMDCCRYAKLPSSVAVQSGIRRDLLRILTRSAFDQSASDERIVGVSPWGVLSRFMSQNRGCQRDRRWIPEIVKPVVYQIAVACIRSDEQR